VPPRDERKISNDVTEQNTSFLLKSVCSGIVCLNKLPDTFHRALNGQGKNPVARPETYMGTEAIHRKAASF
jgi:hypothetical protein